MAQIQKVIAWRNSHAVRLLPPQFAIMAMPSAGRQILGEAVYLTPCPKFPKEPTWEWEQYVGIATLEHDMVYVPAHDRWRPKRRHVQTRGNPVYVVPSSPGQPFRFQDDQGQAIDGAHICWASHVQTGQQRKDIIADMLNQRRDWWAEQTLKYEDDMRSWRIQRREDEYNLVISQIARGNLAIFNPESDVAEMATHLPKIIGQENERDRAGKYPASYTGEPMAIPFLSKSAVQYIEEAMQRELTLETPDGWQVVMAQADKSWAERRKSCNEWLEAEAESRVRDEWSKAKADWVNGDKTGEQPFTIPQDIAEWEKISRQWCLDRQWKVEVAAWLAQSISCYSVGQSNKRCRPRNLQKTTGIEDEDEEDDSEDEEDIEEEDDYAEAREVGQQEDEARSHGDQRTILRACKSSAQRELRILGDEYSILRTGLEESANMDIEKMMTQIFRADYMA